MSVFTYLRDAVGGILKKQKQKPTPPPPAPTPAPVPDPVIASLQREVAGLQAAVAAKDAALAEKDATIAARDKAIAQSLSEVERLVAGQSFDVTLSVINGNVADVISVTGKPPVRGFTVADIPLSLNMEPPCKLNLDIRPTKAPVPAA